MRQLFSVCEYHQVVRFCHRNSRRCQCRFSWRGDASLYGKVLSCIQKWWRWWQFFGSECRGIISLVTSQAGGLHCLHWSWKHHSRIHCWSCSCLWLDVLLCGSHQQRSIATLDWNQPHFWLQSTRPNCHRNPHCYWSSCNLEHQEHLLSQLDCYICQHAYPHLCHHCRSGTCKSRELQTIFVLRH